MLCVLFFLFILCFFFLMMRRPPSSTQSRSSAASDVYKRQAQKIAPVISGQRAIRREMFLSVPEISRVRMGVEIALTRWARDNGVRVSTVVLDGVTHTMKEEKLGPVRGFASRLVMYADIGRVLLGASRSGERRSSRKQPRAER